MSYILEGRFLCLYVYGIALFFELVKGRDWIREASVRFFPDASQLRWGDFVRLQAVQLLKAHDHGMPTIGVNAVWVSSHPNIIVNMGTEDFDLQRHDEPCGALVLVLVMLEHLMYTHQLPLHLSRTLGNTGWADKI